MKDVKVVLLNDGGYEGVLKRDVFPTKPISATLDDGYLWIDSQDMINAGAVIASYTSVVVGMDGFLFANDHNPEFEIVE
ncbi:MAG: hypothetical protein ACN2B6_00270 [Rickettsiales bacterium]